MREQSVSVVTATSLLDYGLLYGIIHCHSISIISIVDIIRTQNIKIALFYQRCLLLNS